MSLCLRAGTSIWVVRVGGAKVSSLNSLKAVFKALDGIDLPDGISISVEVGDTEVSRPVGKARTVTLKATSEEQYVLGIVLEPLKELGKTDSQDDTYSAEEVRKACHIYMHEFRNIGRQHEEIINGKVKILENWIARADFMEGDQMVHKGTWLQGLKIVDDELWQDIKSGKITGLSIGGWADSTRVQ